MTDNACKYVFFALLVAGYCCLYSHGNSVVFGNALMCSAHYIKSVWYNAVKICENEERRLLCYQSEKDTQAIIDSLPTPIKIKRLWLSSKNCTQKTSEECLILYVEKSNDRVLHYLMKSCMEELPFICCDNYQKKTSTDTTVPSSKLSSTTTSTVSETTTTSLVSLQSTSISHRTSTSTALCQSVFRRGILWPQVKTNTLVSLPCPGDSEGMANWFCNATTGDWFPDNPDMSRCRSIFLKRIKEALSNEPSGVTIDTLVKFVRNDSVTLQGNDLVDSVTIMSGLIEKLRDEISLIPENQRFKVTEDSVSKSAAIFDMMILREAWKDLPAGDVAKASSQMLTAIDKYGFLLASTLINKTRHNIVKTNIAMEIHKKNIGTSISLPEVSSGYDRTADISISGLQLDSSRGTVSSIVYVCYANMSMMLIPHRNGELSSLVVSASVTQGRMKEPLSVGAKVEILLENLGSVSNQSACMFWSIQKNTWDDFGCQLKNSNLTHTLCECSHLTNFAVLTDFQGLINAGEVSFFYITVIGCSLSIISLAICIAVFSCYGSLQRGNNSWNVRYNIHRNLCLTLLIANIILLVGLNQTQDKIICAVIAGLLHYFFLSAFSWMLLESLHIYLLLVVVFASKKTHNGKYFLFGYGLPLIIVGITAAIRHDDYGTSQSCWLSIDKGTIWSFTGPVACMLLINFAALALAQYKANKIRSTKDDPLMVMKRWLRVTMILFPVLGITWVFGFLYIGRNYKIAAYAFAFLNSLQGFFIFICHCLLDKKTRSMILTSIRRSTTSSTTAISSPSKKNSGSSILIKNEKNTFTKWQITWNFFQKPWSSFHFDLNLSNNPSGVTLTPRKSSSTTTCEQLPKIVNWNVIQDADSF